MIANLIRASMNKRGYQYITVDGRNKEVRKSLGDYNIYVGPMWRHNVYLPLYRYRRNQKGEHRGYIRRYFIIDAHEVRSTEPSIHVYRVEYYDFQKNINLSGFVGQSKLGKRHASAPKKTVREAISIGIKLASTSVSDRLLNKEDN